MKYKVQVTVAPSDKERLQRQLPGKLGVWKNFQFFINEPIEEADFSPLHVFTSFVVD